MEGESRFLKTHRSWPKVDTILDLSVLEPTTAVLSPNGVFVELIEVRVYFINNLLFHFHGFYALTLNFLH
jgi:hypothetical protein